MYLYTLQSSESSSDVVIRRWRGLSHISNLTPHLPLRMIDLAVMMMKTSLMMREVLSEMRAFMMNDDGDFVQVMIFLTLLCNVRVAYTDLHWDGPESDTGAYII